MPGPRIRGNAVLLDAERGGFNTSNGESPGAPHTWRARCLPPGPREAEARRTRLGERLSHEPPPAPSSRRALVRNLPKHLEGSTARSKVDENLPAAVAEMLRTAGHCVCLHLTLNDDLKKLQTLGRTSQNVVDLERSYGRYLRSMSPDRGQVGTSPQRGELQSRGTGRDPTLGDVGARARRHDAPFRTSRYGGRARWRARSRQPEPRRALGPAPTQLLVQGEASLR